MADTTQPQQAALQTGQPSAQISAAPLDWLFEYPPPRSLPLDQDALRVYERAYHIGAALDPGSVAPPISFTVLLAALFAGEDETSRWFASKAKSCGPDREAVLREKTGLAAITQQESGKRREWPPEGRLQIGQDKNLLTVSSRCVLQNAESWALRVGGSEIGVRHLVAAYVLNPPANHRRQIGDWQLKEGLWKLEFFAWVGPRFTWEAWADTSERMAPTRGLGAFEEKVNAWSVAWLGDAGAEKILARAAELQALSPHDCCRIRTLLFAVIDAARMDAGVGELTRPLLEHVERNEEKYQAAREKHLGRVKRQEQPFEKLDISPRVLNTLETARAIATVRHALQAATEPARPSALHLAGALLSCQVDADMELVELGIDPRALRLEFMEHATGRGEPEDLWLEMLGHDSGAVFEPRPIELNSDDPEACVRLDETWKSDPLAIRADVQSFAALLASTSLEPPLSIGLFGPWGSGKTTFMKRLRRAVDALAGRAESASGRRDYVSKVVHVEFNAWHFSEEALLSSLVETIFREIDAFVKDSTPVAGRPWRDQKLEILKTTQLKLEAAEAARKSADEAVGKAQKELVDRRMAAAEKAATFRTATEAAWAALVQTEAVKKSGIAAALGSTAQSADELRARVAQLRARPARMFADLGLWKTLVFAGIVLVLPPLVSWFATNVLKAGLVNQAVASITAALSTLGAWLAFATNAVRKVDAAITKVSDEYESSISQKPEVIAATKQLEEARAEAEAAQATLDAARELRVRAETEAASAALPAQVLRLVGNRIERLDYSKELTSLSLARSDLESLSRIFRDQRTESSTASQPPTQKGPRAVERVILYIDDLDRCKPRDVVRVLQLVHMLLAFELFAVVVAVDARWVEDALRRGFLEQGDEERRGVFAEGLEPGFQLSPRAYLEKIFQVAFWLEPMSAPRAARYLASLVRTTTSARDTTALTTSIDILPLELDYMRALASYVGESPRRVKRLVNAYRLIKARLSKSQLEAFLERNGTDGGSGPYQLVIGLLVIGTGAPAEGSQILNALSNLDPAQSVERVVDEFRARDHADWTMAARVLETVLRSQRKGRLDVLELRGWARRVDRHLLHRTTTPKNGSPASYELPAQSLGPPR